MYFITVLALAASPTPDLSTQSQEYQTLSLTAAVDQFQALRAESK